MRMILQVSSLGNREIELDENEQQMVYDFYELYSTIEILNCLIDDKYNIYSSEIKKEIDETALAKQALLIAETEHISKEDAVERLFEDRYISATVTLKQNNNLIIK